MRSPGRPVFLLVLLLWLVGIDVRFAQQQASPDCGLAPYDCAVAQVQRQEFDAAIRTLERVVAQEPANLRALNLLGIALTGACKPEDGSARFRAALALDPRFAPALRNLAMLEPS